MRPGASWAEARLNHWGKPRFQAYSAGSHPKGAVHPFALDVLRRHHVSIQNLRSKGREEFAGPHAPHLDFVRTVCDRAAQEMCPIWPGQATIAHWWIADPAAGGGTEPERRQAFDTAFRALEARVTRLAKLQLETLDRPALQRQLDAIGAILDDSARASQ